jgi:hypothetical protein
MRISVANGWNSKWLLGGQATNAYGATPLNLTWNQSICHTDEDPLTQCFGSASTKLNQSHMPRTDQRGYNHLIIESISTLSIVTVAKQNLRG